MRTTDVTMMMSYLAGDGSKITYPLGHADWQVDKAEAASIVIARLPINAVPQF